MIWHGTVNMSVSFHVGGLEVMDEVIKEMIEEEWDIIKGECPLMEGRVFMVETMPKLKKGHKIMERPENTTKEDFMCKGKFKIKMVAQSSIRRRVTAIAQAPSPFSVVVKEAQLPTRYSNTTNDLHFHGNSDPVVFLGWFNIEMDKLGPGIITSWEQMKTPILTQFQAAVKYSSPITTFSNVKQKKDLWKHLQGKDPTSFADVLAQVESFNRYVVDAEQPLFEGSECTKLESVLKLHNWKARFGVSDKAFTDLLESVGSFLPKDHVLPGSTYEAKKTLTDLGFEYVKIHACPNDFILYRGPAAESLSKCPKCHLSRWKIGKDGKVRVNVPAKVMWYFPIIPRFKRLFKSAATAKLMSWHVDNRSKDGKMCHSSDSPAWQNVDCRWPEFGSEARNIRLGLAANGHHRYLDEHHPYRRQRIAFDGQEELGYAPEPLSGEEVLMQQQQLEFSFGKGEGEKDRTKDNVASRLDLIDMGVRTDLAPEIEGCIAKGYLKEELAKFCTGFFSESSRTAGLQKDDDKFSGPVGRVTMKSIAKKNEMRHVSRSFLIILKWNHTFATDRGVKSDDLGFMLVNFNPPGYKHDKFDSVDQVSQVFDVEDPCDTNCDDDDDVDEYVPTPAPPGALVQRLCELSVNTIDNKVAFGMVYPGNDKEKVQGIDIPLGHISYTTPAIKKKEMKRPGTKPGLDLNNLKSDFLEAKPSAKVPKGFNLLYKHVVTWMKTTGVSIQIKCEKEVFGHGKVIYLLHENVQAVSEFEMLGQAVLASYMTMHWILAIIWEGEIYFLNPLPHPVQFPDLEKALSRALKSFNSETGRGNHKPSKAKFLSGFPKQPGGTECAYVVTRYMKEIINDTRLTFTTKWLQKTRMCYTKEQLDEVRVEALGYIQEHI
ncbi:hypothetical protein AgCh_023997 [Apium graveolens]